VSRYAAEGRERPFRCIETTLARVGAASRGAPEGKVVELVPLEDVVLNGSDDLDDGERAELHAAIREGFEDVKAGRTIVAKQ